jgi:acylglycerol lipase
MYPIGRLEMLINMLERAADLSSGKSRLSNHVKALDVAHGTADRLTSYNATKQWVESQTNTIKKRESKKYDGWSHLLHVDMPENREIFADDCAS